MCIIVVEYFVFNINKLIQFAKNVKITLYLNNTITQSDQASVNFMKQMLGASGITLGSR